MIYRIFLLIVAAFSLLMAIVAVYAEGFGQNSTDFMQWAVIFILLYTVDNQRSAR